MLVLITCLWLSILRLPVGVVVEVEVELKRNSSSMRM